jgi:hypothetical protein
MADQLRMTCLLVYSEQLGVQVLLKLAYNNNMTAPSTHLTLIVDNTAPKPPVPTPTKQCWNCLSPVNVRCCEFGRDR